MKTSMTPRILMILLAMSVFVSCGGTTGGDDFAGGGVGGTGISVGKITAFGSVFVNGVEFDTSGAIIIKDGVEVATVSDSEDQEHLRVGMIVAVRGTFNADGLTGTASRVEFKDNLEGPVSVGSIDLINLTFQALGQTVKVDMATVFEDSLGIQITGNPTAILSAIDDGNIVEVSGFVNAGGVILASYIEIKAESFTPGEDEIELKGTISSLDDTNKIFMIGGLIVDYSSAELKDIPTEGLSDGLFVEVKSTTGFYGSGVLIASEVEVEDKIPGHEEGDKVEIEGFVTSFISISEPFEVNGQPVQVTSETRFEDGASPDGIALNVRIEVEGTVNASGVLVAEEISLESGEDGEDSSEEDSLPGSEGTSGDTSNNEEDEE